MKRSKPLQVNPAKAREWQQRSRKPLARTPMKRTAPASRPREAKPEKPSTRKPRRNDSGWKAEVHARYGHACVSCGARRHVQADHIWPRSQGGPSDPRNGLPLCGEFSETGLDCHGRKTASTMLIRPEWLAPDQIAYLEDVGWVAWDEKGQPHGRGWRHFAPRDGAGEGGR